MMKKQYLLVFSSLLVMLFSACSAFEKVDVSMQSFNQHAEGFTTLVTIITLLGGWLITGIGWLSRHFMFRSNSSSDIKDKKRPVLPFLSINGKSLFRYLTWNKALKTSETIAKELLDVNNTEKYYDPTMIVCIGRGGAIYGSLISYQLGEMPILALDRSYDHKPDGRETKTMYPFRIPKAYLKRVLLVAGESHTRKTLKIFTSRLKELGAGEIRNCVFYNQILPPERLDADVEIHYHGVKDKKDYLMPWQTEQSLHPSENKADAEIQNSRIGRYVSEKDNRFDTEGFYCMRHAETDANGRDQFIGSGTNILLSARGEAQAREVGRYFQRIGVNFDLVYCSPMTRCIQTANEVCRFTGGVIVPKEELKEFDYGEWEGMARTDIPTQYPAEYKQYCSGDLSFCAPGSNESLGDVRNRMQGFLKELVEDHKGEKVLVVTHKTAGRLLYQLITPDTVESFREIPMANASIGFVSFVDGQKKIVLDNKTCS